MGRKTNVVLTVGAASIAAWAASKAVKKPIPRAEKKALNFNQPIVIANRGGLMEAPENTNAAFSHATSLGIHGLAIDIRLTKDEQIVVFHDEYVNRTTNFEGKLSDYTLNELKEADAAYYFEDENGDFPYRGQGEKVLTLQEVLQQYQHLLIYINIQDTPDTYEGSLIPSKLWYLIEEIGAEDRVAVTSAFDEQVDRFNLYAQNRVAIGAGNSEVNKAYTAFTSQFGHFYQPKTDFFCCPQKLKIFPFNRVGFISFLSKLNIPIYYKDVLEPEHITTLVNAGAAGFLTDQPAKVMESIQYKIND